MTVNVVNKRRLKSPRFVYVGRPSLFGSPFVVGRDGSLSKVLEKYTEHLCELLQTEPAVVRALEIMRARHLSGEEVNLCCWCAPKACHADVIKEAVEMGRDEFLRTHGK